MLTSLTSTHLGALAATQEAVYAVRPALETVIDTYEEVPLGEFSERLTARRGVLPAFSEPSPLSTFLIEIGAPRYNNQIVQRGGCATISHFSVASHEVEFGAMVLYSLAHLLRERRVVLPNFGMSCVPGGNVTTARGGLVLSERTPEGKRLSLKLQPRKRRLAGIATDMDRLLMKYYPAYGRKDLDRMLTSIEMYRGEGFLSQWKANRLAEVVQAAYTAGLSATRFERQVNLVSRQLWQQQLFQTEPAVKLETVLIERETEFHFASYAPVLADDFPYQMIFDPALRAETIAAMSGIPMCWDEERGSHFFRYIDERGYEKPLRVHGDMLVCPDDENIQVPLEPDVICEKLLLGRLHFTVFMHMVMCFFFDILPLGGPMQIEYASQIKARLIELLTKHYGSDYANPLRELPVESAYINMPGLSLVERDGKVQIATAADTAAGGGWSRSQLELLGRTPVGILHLLSIQSIYEFIFGHPPEPFVPLEPLVRQHGLEELVFHEGDKT